MSIEDKLNVHLEHIVMPEGVPLNAKQVLELCDRATQADRIAALQRARKKNPLILPDEEKAAKRWVDQA
jgi:hypothetical protein